MSNSTIIRNEEKQDRKAVYALNSLAFEATEEAKLVEALRTAANPLISQVAEENNKIIGHIMFTPVSLSGNPGVKIMGLAPMAVLPKFQRAGVGSLLIRAGLKKCKEIGFKAVVVLGHPDYYPRFGFTPASSFGIKSEYDVPDEVFMLMEIQTGYLHGISGTISYHVAFSEV